MDHGRYARLEDEQRYVVGSVPPGATAPRLIEDRYLAGTRLRLRRVSGDGPTVLKLGHKVPVEGAGPSAVLHTTCYLDDAEFEALCALPGRTIRKRRWSLGGGAVDEFDGDLDGLVLVEGQRPYAPDLVCAEVTDDPAFTGGALAGLDARAASAVVARARALLR